MEVVYWVKNIPIHPLQQVLVHNHAVELQYYPSFSLMLVEALKTMSQALVLGY
jgi:hypothetical protein